MLIDVTRKLKTPEKLKDFPGCLVFMNHSFLLLFMWRKLLIGCIKQYCLYGTNDLDYLVSKLPEFTWRRWKGQLGEVALRVLRSMHSCSWGFQKGFGKFTLKKGDSLIKADVHKCISLMLWPLSTQHTRSTVLANSINYLLKEIVWNWFIFIHVLKIMHNTILIAAWNIWLEVEMMD